MENNKTRLELYYEIEETMEENKKPRRRIKEDINHIPTLCGCGCTSFNEISDQTEYECRKCGKIWVVQNDK